MRRRSRVGAVVPNTVVALCLVAASCSGSSTAASAGPTTKSSNANSAALTTWAVEDWTVRGFAGRDLFEFGRAHGFEQPPTNEMRITKLDGTQVTSSEAPFEAGLAGPSAKGTTDGRVLVIGRPCTQFSADNIDSGGITCTSKALAAALFDIAKDSWQEIEVPEALIPGGGSMPIVELVGVVGDTAYATTFPDFGVASKASWGVWNIETGEVIAGDAGWTAVDSVESCVLANGTRYDVRSVGTMLSSGNPATKVEIFETSNGPDGMKSPLPKSFDQPVALRCDDKRAIAALGTAAGGPPTVESASDLVSGADVSAAIKGTVVLSGEGAFVGADEAGKRTVLLGDAGPIEFGAAIGGHTISNGVDVLFVDNVGAENVALVRTDSTDTIDAERLAKLIPTPPKVVNKVGEPGTTAQSGAATTLTTR